MTGISLKRHSALKLAVVAAASLTGLTGAAKGDIILTQVSGPTAVAGGYTFTYDAVLSFDGELTTTSPFAQFGTLYDDSTTPLTVSNVTGDLATDFTFSQSLTNTPALNSTPTDSSSYDNVRFTFTGSPTGGPTTIFGSPFNVGSTQIGTNPVDLGQFTITSPYSTETQVSFDGESTASYGTTAGSEQGNNGFTTAPRGAVPEPASLAVLAIAGVTALGRRRRA
jgi:hypothetical protein